MDWPDQGSAEENWKLNGALLDRVIAAGAPIRDAEVSWGALRSHTGFLARERQRMRLAGLQLLGDGYWRKAQRSLVDLAPILLARARTAAARGAQTFAVPEAAPVAAWIAAHVVDPTLRSNAIAWLERGTTYHDLVRLCARATLALDRAAGEPVFRAKVGDELEPMLALWPHQLVVPTPTALSLSDVIRLRAFPVHPLGLVAAPAWADGSLRAPSEFFFHDLDHARFKVREDLQSRGFEIPDAYRDGTTVDPRTGRHRSILSFAKGGISGVSREEASRKQSDGDRVLDHVHAIANATTARAANLLLFEIVHEKSLPLDPRAVACASRDDAHCEKLWRKWSCGFFGGDAPDLDVMNALPAARAALAVIPS